MWNIIIAFLTKSSKTQNDANKQDFEMKLNLIFQGQSIHNTVGVITKVIYISDQYLVILTWMVNNVLYRQNQNGVNLDFLRYIWPWR